MNRDGAGETKLWRHDLAGKVTGAFPIREVFVYLGWHFHLLLTNPQWDPQWLICVGGELLRFVSSTPR